MTTPTRYFTWHDADDTRGLGGGVERKNMESKGRFYFDSDSLVLKNNAECVCVCELCEALFVNTSGCVCPAAINHC